MYLNRWSSLDYVVIGQEMNMNLLSLPVASRTK